MKGLKDERIIIMKKTMKRVLALVLAALAIVAAFAGCSGKANNDANTDAGNDTAAAKYIIATDTVFKPFEYTDAQGNFVGIDVEILAAIAEDQGFEYELKSLGWDAAIAACQAGQANGMIAGASITEERKNSGWIFSDPYYIATQCAAVKADSEINSIKDLKGAQIAVKTGTQGAQYAESLKDELGLKLTYFEDSPTMYQAVTGGQCVACFEDTPIMKEILHSRFLRIPKTRVPAMALQFTRQKIRSLLISLMQALQTSRLTASMTKSSISTLANC